MKFSDGFWLNKKNYNVSYATHTYKLDCSHNSILAFAAPYIVYNRGMTLGGPNLEVRISSDLENVIRVSVCHFKGTLKNSPKFDMHSSPDFIPRINETDEYAELISGKTSARVYKGNVWDIRFYYDGKLLTHNGSKTTSA